MCWIAHTEATMRRLEFRHIHDGEVIVTELILATVGEWADCEESGSRAYSVATFDGGVYALRLPVLPCLRGANTSRSAHRSGPDIILPGRN